MHINVAPALQLYMMMVNKIIPLFRYSIYSDLVDTEALFL